MKLIQTKFLKAGDILYETVNNADGSPLLSKGTILGPLYIELLKSKNLKEVKICTKDFETNIVSIENYSTKQLYNSINSKAHNNVNNVLKQEKILEIFNNSSEHVKDHSYNVAIFTAMLLLDKPKGLSGKTKDIITGALLHDVGKNMIPQEIMFAPRKLNNIEFEIVKLHTVAGHSFLVKNGFCKVVSDIALHHHETFIGNGYPDKLDGNSIPWYIDLIHICDIYDALCSKRIYKKPVIRDRAIDKIIEQRDIFNPDVFDLFMTKMPKHFIGDLFMAYNRIYEVVGYTNSDDPILKELITNRDILYSEIASIAIPVDINDLKEGMI